ncbi:MAG: ABC transporter substrate-binding protein, partial [Chloroflexia bacterium]
MARKQWSRLVGLLLIAGLVVPLLAGCSPAPTTPPPATKPPQPTATPAPPPTATPVPTPVIVHLNLGSEPPTLDPALATDLTSIDVIQQLFLGLTGLKPETGEVIPRLATSWDVSADGLVYTFHMRNDAYWVRYDPVTDSFEKVRPVTAYDVEYGVRRTVMPETASDYAYVLYVLKNAKAINTTQVPT